MNLILVRIKILKLTCQGIVITLLVSVEQN